MEVEWDGTAAARNRLEGMFGSLMTDSEQAEAGIDVQQEVSTLAPTIARICTYMRTRTNKLKQHDRIRNRSHAHT